MNGGGSVFFIFLVGVLVVFGAGYLLSQSDQMAVYNAVCEETNKQSAEMYATAVPQVTKAAQLETDIGKVRAEAEAYKAAQLKAEDELRVLADELVKERANLEAAKQAQARAESSYAAEAAKRQTVEGQLAAKRDELALEKEARVRAETERGVALADYQKTLAERNQAVVVLDAANKENAELKARVARYEEQQRAQVTPIIPASGGQTNPKVNSNLAYLWLWVAFGGVAVFFGAYFAGRSSGKPHGSMPYAKDVTTVVMRVEDARKYAREARKNAQEAKTGGGSRPRKS